MRVLVTGGAGFIGSHVVEALLRDGHEPRVLDCLHTAAHRGVPDDLPEGVEIRFADVRDRAAVEDAVAGIDAVSHQAAMVGLGADLGDLPDYVSHNGVGTAELLRALALAGFTGPLVLAGSMVVYGEGAYRCPDHGPVRPPARALEDLAAGHFEPVCGSCGLTLAVELVDEDAPPDPRSVYAATKLHQEHLCQAYARETGVALTTLRYHNVYGPRMPRDTPYAGVASIFRSAIESGVAPRVFEDGRQQRDFVHVRDVARANLLALTAGEPGAFNVASGEPHTIADLADALWRSLDTRGPPPRVTGEFRAGDVRHVVASPERARRRLGFTAQVRFADGVSEFATAPLRSTA